MTVDIQPRPDGRFLAILTDFNGRDWYRLYRSRPSDVLADWRADRASFRPHLT